MQDERGCEEGKKGREGGSEGGSTPPASSAGTHVSDGCAHLRGRRGDIECVRSFDRKSGREGGDRESQRACVWRARVNLFECLTQPRFFYVKIWLYISHFMSLIRVTNEF